MSSTSESSGASRDPLGQQRDGIFEYSRDNRVYAWMDGITSVGQGTAALIRLASACTDGWGHDDVVLALRHAARQGAHSSVKGLVRRHPELLPEDLGLALHDAAEGGHFKVMLALASRPDVVDTEDEHGATALRKAIEYQRDTPWDGAARGELETLRSRLLPADILDEAAAQGDVDRYLSVFRGRDGVLGKTAMSEALHEAAQRGHASIARGLLDRGCPPQYENERLETPLHHALDHSHLDVARVLLSCDAVIDTPDFHRLWASHKAEDLAEARPQDAEAAEIQALLLSRRATYRRFLAEHGIDPTLRKLAEDLMERLPAPARQGASAGRTFAACLILADRFRCGARAKPLSEWASALGVDEEALRAGQERLLACCDEQFNKGRLPDDLRSLAGPHLKERGHAAVLVTGFVLSKVVNRPTDEPLSLDVLWRLQERVANTVDHVAFNQAAVLAAEHYLRTLPLAELHAELRDEYLQRNGTHDPELIVGYRLLSACLMLADLHLSAAPLGPEAWSVPLGKTPSETAAFQAKLLGHLNHDLDVPGLVLPET